MLINPTLYTAYNKLATHYQQQSTFQTLYYYVRCVAVRKPLQTAKDMMSLYAEKVCNTRIPAYAPQRFIE